MRTAMFGAWLGLALTALASAAPPPPATPAPVLEIVSARAFALEEEAEHLWRKEKPRFRSGYLLVLEVDPALVVPRQRLEPVLYVGRQTAERVNQGARSGFVVAIVPGVLDDPADPAYLDLEQATMWFGTPDLPERVDRETLERERRAAEAAGARPFAAGRVRAALARGGAPLEAKSRYELLRAAALLIKEHALDETELADGLLVPKLPKEAD